MSVRLEGQAIAEPTTGRLEVSFLRQPATPFSELCLTLNGGPRAPLANPLSCGRRERELPFSAYTGGACGAELDAVRRQRLPGLHALLPGPEHAHSLRTPPPAPTRSYTFNLARADGQQYLGKVRRRCPAGLLGAIPSVTLCGEPQAAGRELRG